ncbi:hypothetical protein HMPREF0653_01311 [Prevotella disiens JCM 6334 = ATCC 29426]|uniref:Uncharacterized protein n=1 Tax=Prevotella disiens JCM 6334 = ATCC 29426 TaxID=1235811 RepID=A0ABN0NSD8_9BACT|nr:hypothetical protein HMPREF0653_01311 [Prevotella disiens JCM 6334 = ATCC 29426]
MASLKGFPYRQIKRVSLPRYLLHALLKEMEKGEVTARIILLR